MVGGSRNVMTMAQEEFLFLLQQIRNVHKHDMFLFFFPDIRYVDIQYPCQNV